MADERSGKPGIAHVLTFTPGAGRPDAPRDLEPAEAELWRKTVGSMPPGWFCSTEPLLKAFVTTASVAECCAAALRARPFNMHEGTVRFWERTIRLHCEVTEQLCRLARALRISPLSAMRSRTAQVMRLNQGARPWEDHA